MDCRVQRVASHEAGGALKAFCDVAIGERLVIRGLRIVEGRAGLFIAMPRQRGKNGKWYDSVVLVCPELKSRVCRSVLDAFARFQSDGAVTGRDRG